MTASYVLLAAAEADLRAVIRYTRKQWGDRQTRSYVADLRRGMEGVATGQGLLKDMSALYPGLRVARCNHHYIFCLPRDGEPAVIVAIFHERMDVMARLAGRFDV